ncbi:gluconokinase [Oecophyllibacter saccharovorans]|nr:gluconokinase [Oecophyllibacter saccharovorans]
MDPMSSEPTPAQENACKTAGAMIAKDLKRPAIPPQYIVVMGVSGTGKTTVAVALADLMGWPFQEGDDLHPPSNVEKMRNGHPLNDDDRAPWLELCHDWLAKQVKAGHGAVLTCSSLKRRYREILAKGLPVEFVYLYTTPEVVEQRIKARTGHYMPPTLLPSQFATLEEPATDEPVIVVSGDATPSEILEMLLCYLELHPEGTKCKVEAHMSKSDHGRTAQN